MAITTTVTVKCDICNAEQQSPSDVNQTIQCNIQRVFREEGKPYVKTVAFVNPTVHVCGLCQNTKPFKEILAVVTGSGSTDDRPKQEHDGAPC